MGKYDDISPEELRSDLIRFARLILQLEEEGGLLASAAEVQKLMGDLRRKLFAYEIRGTPKLGSEEAEAPAETDPLVEESLRVVREALERQEEMIDDWIRPFSPDDDEDDEA